MVKIDVQCPNCGKAGKVPQEHLGKTGKCQKCGSRFTLTPHTAKESDIEIESVPDNSTAKVVPPPLPESKTVPPPLPGTWSQPFPDSPTPSPVANSQPKLSKRCAVGALIGAVFVALSVPMKWEEIGAGTEFSITTTGSIVIIDAVFLGLLSLAQFGAKTEKDLLVMAKGIAFFGCCVALYAGYTAVVNNSIHVGGETAIKNGSGIWFGLIGGLVALFSQATLLADAQKKEKAEKEKVR